MYDVTVNLFCFVLPGYSNVFRGGECTLIVTQGR